MNKLLFHPKTSIALIFVILLTFFSTYKLILIEDGLSTFKKTIDGTPILITEPAIQSQDIVFIAHGFAGSTSFMRPIAVALARAGYKTIRYDFLGHGRHSKPYSGDITTTEGATQLFLDQTNKIINHYFDENKLSRGVIIGHSMASDIIFRAALTNNKIISSIGISNYTDVIEKNKPDNVFILNGQWESHLRKKGLNILSNIGIKNPQENTLYGSIETGTARKVTSVTNADHVGILYSRQTQEELIQWVDSVFKNKNIIRTNAIGVWTSILLLSLFSGFCLSIRFLPLINFEKIKIPFKPVPIVMVLAGVSTPLLLNFHFLSFTSFPAHDYLINHLILFSVIMCLVFPKDALKSVLKNFNLAITVPLFIFYTLIFGSVLDKYVSSFYPTGFRIPLFFLLLLGCIPISIIIQMLHGAHNRAWITATLAKSILILSLSLAIVLNFEELFLLAYAILLLIAFFFVFGFLSNYLDKRLSNPFSIGLANGVSLAWTLATAIPLYMT